MRFHRCSNDAGDLQRSMNYFFYFLFFLFLFGKDGTTSQNRSVAESLFRFLMSRVFLAGKRKARTPGSRKAAW